MSYNISGIEVLKIDAKMRRINVIELYKKFSTELPESCFLTDVYFYLSKIKCSKCEAKQDIDACFCKKCGEKQEHDEFVELTKISWCGMCSSNINDTLKEIVPFIIGEVQFIAVWEGGDYFSGHAIKDGKYAICDVIRSIKLPEGW